MFHPIDRTVGSRIRGLCLLLMVGVAVACWVHQAGAQNKESATTSRVTQGLQVFYDFANESGSQIADRSGAKEPIDLVISNPNAVSRRKGGLQINGKTLIRSSNPASRLIGAIRRSNEVTIEAWIDPENDSQKGPARIVTISKDSSNRNLTLGQDGNKYVVRMRTTGTSDNGIPSTDTKSKAVQTKLTHIVYTRAGSGTTKIYLNGKLQAQSKAPGRTSNWNNGYRLALGDELVGGRLWKGTYHLVAIYDRDLSPREVNQNFRAGPAARSEQSKKSIAEIAKSKNQVLFETQIAPLLAKHCLECHDSATHQGDLNLARKTAALQGGESGLAVVPMKPDESTLWLSVANDEMPHDRPPLSADEKRILNDWISGGAEWTIDFIDPAIYLHAGQTHENWIRRLTAFEYVRTVQTTFGVDVEMEAKEILPADSRADGFANTAYNLTVDLKHVNAYAKLARIVVGKLEVRKFAKRFRSKLSMTDNDMRGLIEEMGKWVLRGPLDDREVVLFRGISTSVASAGGSVDEAIGYVLQAMIQSPRFIYRIEDQRDDGFAYQVSEYELASRISYLVWGSSPDETLFRAAEKGDLYDPTSLQSQIDRMLKDPRAVDQSLEFVSQWLDLDRLDNMQPNSDRFPKWTPELAGDMRRETLDFAKEVLWHQQRPMSKLLDAQLTFLSPRLAKHYGVQPKNAAWKMYDLQEISSRGGLMTQGSVLTVGGDDASMVTRGLLVMHELLRGVVKDPPACVDTTPVASEPGSSQRSIAEARIKNGACGGCHGKFEPLAFGLEKYDGLGAYHERDEHHNRLREDGVVLIPGEAKPNTYQTSAELMALLAQSERVKESLTWKVTQFALGRPLLADDAPVLRRIHHEAQKDGGTYHAIISAIVRSDLVQKSTTQNDLN